MNKNVNKVMNYLFELPLSSDKDNHPTATDFVWLGLALNLFKFLVCELCLICTEIFMICIWCALITYYLPATKVDGNLMVKIITFMLFIITLLVLGIFCFITYSTLLKYVIEITFWIKNLWTCICLTFGYCRVLISFATTVMVVKHLMYLFWTVVRSIHRMFGISTHWLGHPDKHLTTSTLIRYCIFFYGLVWATGTFSLIYISGSVILIKRIITK
uniref:Uncharacterized protein n=1 Tax=Schizaphis graminum TaxID=13262 RepID=A0A2S2P391_SCHGA